MGEYTMNEKKKNIVILIADDDPDDRFMIKESLEEINLPNIINFVEDGEQLMDYLKHRGSYAGKADTPLPGLILLDLNMPKKDGREVLSEIKIDKSLCMIPVVVFTTSKAEEDIIRSYNLGVNSFITKPLTFDSLVDIMKTLTRYWLEIVELPDNIMNCR